MMIIHLLQCGQTEWRAAGRMQGRLSLPLSPAGVGEAESLAAQMAEVKLDAIYSAQCEACRQTAAAVAARTGQPKVRRVEALAELDVGLWQGMLAKEIKRRQPKVYRQWQEEPERVTPPEGENLSHAYQRIVGAVTEVLRRHEASDALAVVVAPMAAAMLRCHLAHQPLTEVWKAMRPEAGSPERFSVAPAEKQ